MINLPCCIIDNAATRLRVKARYNKFAEITVAVALACLEAILLGRMATSISQLLVSATINISGRNLCPPSDRQPRCSWSTQPACNQPRNLPYSNSERHTMHIHSQMHFRVKLPFLKALVAFRDTSPSSLPGQVISIIHALSFKSRR